MDKEIVEWCRKQLVARTREMEQELVVIRQKKELLNDQVRAIARQLLSLVDKMAANRQDDGSISSDSILMLRQDLLTISQMADLDGREIDRAYLKFAEANNQKDEVKRIRLKIFNAEKQEPSLHLPKEPESFIFSIAKRIANGD